MGKPVVRIPAVTLGALLLGAFAGCSGAPTAKQPRQPSPERLEDESVLKKHAKQLEALERAFLKREEGYEARRQAAVAEEPGLAAWLAKAIVHHVARDHDALLASGFVLERVEQREQLRTRVLLRGRRELVSLGDPGRKAIVHYLLRNTRGQWRELARYLLRVHPENVVISTAERELAEGTATSARDALKLLARFAANDRSLAVIERATASRDWQMRGTAVRALGAAYRHRNAVERGARLWEFYRGDEDSWVRQQALLALGDLGDTNQVRALVDELEALQAKERGREAAAAAASLKALTGQSFGTSAGKWRQWLGS